MAGGCDLRRKLETLNRCEAARRREHPTKNQGATEEGPSQRRGRYGGGDVTEQGTGRVYWLIVMLSPPRLESNGAAIL